MGLCSHNIGDPPATYVYKLRIRRYCVQISLMMFIVLPLIYIIPKNLFHARFHTVTRVEVIAQDIDLSSGNVTTSTEIMQFDEDLAALTAQKLCGSSTATEAGAATRDPSNCDSFALSPETSIQFCGTTGLTSASKRGQGSYYYPTAPEWDETALTWRTVGLQRFYLTGNPVLHRLSPLTKVNVIFKGYPEFKTTETFFKMPCDMPLDEVLFGIMIIIMVRVAVCTMQMVEEISKLNFVTVNDSEPVRFGARANILVWLKRIDLLCIFIILLMLYILSDYTTQTERCKYNVPELYWTSM